MINIPIYRAKQIDSDEYRIGYLEEHSKNEFYISLLPNKLAAYRIDPTTLSIHFPDMLDSQGNKIFASLSEDGKGGDITNKGICLYETKYNQFRIITNLKTRTWLEVTRDDLDNYPIKVIGIQE